MRPSEIYRANDWRAKVGVPVLLYVVHGNAGFEPDKAKREREWESWCVGYWTDHNGGGWVWHGLIGIVTHVAELPPRPTL